MYIFLSYIKIGCRRGKVRSRVSYVRREVYEAARVESCFRLEAGLYPKEERKIQKKQWDEDHKRISVARDVRESWKNIKCMCVYSSDTAFAQHLSSLELQSSCDDFKIPQDSHCHGT